MATETLRGYDAGLAAGPYEHPDTVIANEAADNATIEQIAEALGADYVFGARGEKLTDYLDGGVLFDVLTDYLPDGKLDVERFTTEGLPRVQAELQKARERMGHLAALTADYYRHKLAELREGRVG